MSKIHRKQLEGATDKRGHVFLKPCRSGGLLFYTIKQSHLVYKGNCHKNTCGSFQNNAHRAGRNDFLLEAIANKRCSLIGQHNHFTIAEATILVLRAKSFETSQLRHAPGSPRRTNNRIVHNYATLNSISERYAPEQGRRSAALSSFRRGVGSWESGA
jgi:hypothetical protein